MRTLSFFEIVVGQQASFEIAVTAQDLDGFASLSGDRNPLHVEEDFARNRGFSGRVVYGMQLASYFSTLVGMHLPGERCLYLSQAVTFLRPAYVGDMLLVRGTVEQKVSSLNVLVIKTEILRVSSGEVLVEGSAQVQLIEPT